MVLGGWFKQDNNLLMRHYNQKENSILLHMAGLLNIVMQTATLMGVCLLQPSLHLERRFLQSKSNLSSAVYNSGLNDYRYQGSRLGGYL